MRAPKAESYLWESVFHHRGARKSNLYLKGRLLSRLLFLVRVFKPLWLFLVIGLGSQRFGPHWFYNSIRESHSPQPRPHGLGSWWVCYLLPEQWRPLTFLSFLHPVLCLLPLASCGQSSFWLSVASVAPFLPYCSLPSSFHIYLSKCGHPSVPLIFPRQTNQDYAKMQKCYFRADATTCYRTAGLSRQGNKAKIISGMRRLTSLARLWNLRKIVKLSLGALMVTFNVPYPSRDCPIPSCVSLCAPCLAENSSLLRWSLIIAKGTLEKHVLWNTTSRSCH